MKPFAYHNLHDGALQLLEGDPEMRAAYLDFLTMLHDIVNAKAPFGEPSLFDESVQTEGGSALVEALLEESDIQAVALENQEKAFALLEGGSHDDAWEFIQALLREYNVIRLLRSHGGARRAIA